MIEEVYGHLSPKYHANQIAKIQFGQPPEKLAGQAVARRCARLHAGDGGSGVAAFMSRRSPASGRR